MAILKQGKDEYEVRIKRYPDNTYFDEHVKIDSRDKAGARSCDRYIVGEPGVAYSIEVVLKKGFNLGEFTHVGAKLFFPGHETFVAYMILKPDSQSPTKSNTSKTLKFADVEAGGRKMDGARFVFQSLAADAILENDSNENGLAAATTGFFRVDVYKRKYLEQSSKERVLVREEDVAGTQRVDEVSYNKGGIAYGLGFVGGRQGGDVKNHSKTLWETVKGPRFQFFFHYRTREFLERVGIIKYPPPLHVYTWEQLIGYERKKALEQLQEIVKRRVYPEFEAETGGIRSSSGKLPNRAELKEWRAWINMSVVERKQAYENLQKAKQQHDREEASREIESKSQGPPHLANDDNKDESKTRNPSETNTTPNSGQVSIKSENDSGPTKGTIIKQEVIDLEEEPSQSIVEVKREVIDLDDEPSFTVARPKNARNSALTSNRNTDDGDLQRKKEKARQLAEDIETEERLLRLSNLKRQQRALENEIEAAERKKLKRENP